MKQKIVLLFLLMMTMIPAMAQDVLTGVVKDSQGEPIIGANVLVVGTTRSAVTNLDGRFEIAATVGEPLQISYIGFSTQTLRASHNMNVIMSEDTQHLNDVVVVGYGTQKKVNLTGAVSALTSDELVVTKNQNLQNMLTGKVAGVRVVQKTSEPGEFNNMFDIRGFGSPLIVIDGVPRDDMVRMDPNDIESISVLKDASAAIYGVRASNGVVLITTKRGKGAPKVEYNMYYGWQRPADVLKPVDAVSRYTLSNEYYMRELTNPTQKYPESVIQPYLDGTRTSTDWYDAVMKSSTPQQSHNVSLSGGSDHVNYFLSLGYQDQKGFFTSDALDYYRFNLRANIGVQVTKDLKVGLRLAGIKDRRRGNSTPSWSIFKGLWRSIPSEPIYANNTAPYYQKPESTDDNPYALINTGETGYIKNRVNALNTTFEAEYKVPFVKGLSLRATYNYDRRDTDNKTYQKAFHQYTYNEATGNYDGTLRLNPTYVSHGLGYTYTTLWNAAVNYDNTFGLHHVSGVFLFEEQYRDGDNVTAQRNLDIASDQLAAGNGDNNQIGRSSYYDPYATHGWIGRFNYDFGGKYLAEFSFRYEASSVFRKNAWGFFPGGSIGWRISEENFIKNNKALNFIDNLKLRASYAHLGTDAGENYQFLDGYTYPNTAGGAFANFPTGYVFDGEYTNALAARSIANKEFTWETDKIANIGLDVDMWKGLLGFTVELFQRDKTGIPARRSGTVPGTFGSTMPQENLNSNRTKGFEVEVRHHNKVGDLTYSVKGMISMTRGMQRYMEVTPAGNSYQYWRNYRINRYNDIWFGYDKGGRYESYDQIYNSMYSNSGTLPGDYIYADWNQDGTIDDNDRHPIATTTNPGASFQDQRNYPLMNFGLTLTGEWRGFDLNMLWQGSAMSYVAYGEQLSAPLLWDGNALDMFLDRWHPADPTAHPYDPATQWVSGYYGYGGQKGVANTNSAFMMQKGNYVRLKSIELGYSLPKKWLSVVGIDKVRLFFTGYNLLTFTGVKGVDPERPTDLYGYMYPLNKTYNFGANITF